MALALAMVISALPGISVGAAEGDYMLFNAEFNGSDDTTYWSKFDNGGNKADGSAGKVADGVLTTVPGTTGFGFWGAYWGEDNALSTKDEAGNYKENLYLEMKFKIEGAVKNTEIWSLGGTRRNIDATSTNFAFVKLQINDGKLAGGSAASTTSSDYALSTDTWYTLKSRVNFADHKVYTEIVDEAGNSGNLTCNFWNGVDINNIMSLKLHKNADGDATYVTDYVRFYDGDMLGEVNATYDGVNLDGANNVPVEFVAELTFTNAITEADMNKISIDNGAETQMVLSDDGKIVMMLLSDLREGTRYTINVPDMGGNLGKKISFKTVENSCFLLKAEFDGTDDKTYWVAFKGNGNDQHTDGRESGTIADGVLTTTSSSTGFGCWGAYWGTENALSAKNGDEYKKNIYFETKFKVQENFAGDEKRIVSIAGHCDYNSADNKGFFRAGIKNGKLSLGNEDSTTETDYALTLDKWYTIKSRIDFADKKAYTEITDDAGNSGTFESGFLWGANFSNIQSLSMHQNDAGDVTYVTDYVRLWDADLVEPVEVKYGENFVDLDGATGIGSELSATVLFPMTVTENDVSNISIDGASLSARLSDDNKTVTLTISGLEYRTKYNLIIPAVGMNQEKTVSFTTEDDPKYYFRAEFDGIDDKTLWTAYGADGNKKDIDFDSLIDADSGEITMSAGNVSFGRMKVEFPEAIDVTGKDNVIWETKLSFKNAITNNNRFMGINDSAAGHIEIGVIDSKFYYGGVEGGGSTDTGVLMEAGKEYILSASMDFVEDKFALTIKDADNNVLFAGEKVGLGWGKGTDEINYINLPSLSDGNTVTMDYVRLYDGDYIDVSEFSAEKPVFDKDKLTVGEAVTATVNYQSPDEREIALIIATYDSDNRLTGITKVETVTEVDSKDSVELTVTPKTGDAKIKAFCWNSVSGMSSLTEANELK